jgi:glucose-1-phosphate thymidylyltransferase
MRLFDVLLTKGVVVIPDPTRWTGPWLSATRRPSLQRVANRPIICHVLDALAQAGVVEIAILTPPDALDEITAGIADEGPNGVAVSYLVNDRCATSEDPLLAASEFVGNAPCVLHHANGLLGAPLESFIQALRDEPSDALLLVREDAGETRRLRLVPQRLLTATENGLTPAPGGVAGVCLLGPGMLRRVAGLESEPATPTLDFATLAERLARDGGRVHMRAIHDWRQFTGDALDLLDMNRTALDAMDFDSIQPPAGNGNRFEGPIAIHPSASVSSSVIIGPVIVGADALIADSYIGPHTSIAERVRIEGAELERSIVLADASVLHVGGRLVASVVGREARVFRDFSVPRALRLQVGDGDEVALC